MIAIRDRVRFVETDMMGVVHHANYLRYMERARSDMLRIAGIDALSYANLDDEALIKAALKSLPASLGTGITIARHADLAANTHDAI